MGVKKRWLALMTAGLMLIAPFASARQDVDVRRRALLVGCDDFVMHEDTMPSAQMNVRRIQEMLRTDSRGYDGIYAYQTGFSDKDQLLAAIAAAFAQADADDVSLIYICTHGLYDRVTFEPSLVISDGVTEDVLDAGELRAALDAVPGQKVILLDACNSGAFIGKGEWDDRMKNWFMGEDYVVLTSAGASENSFLWHSDRQIGGSYFADGLSEGLGTRTYDLDGDGTITMQETYKGILEEHGASTAHCYPQTSDFPLFVYDPQADSGGERPVSGLTLDTAVLDGGEDTLYFSFTVQRPVRLQYQLIYYKDGKWRFDKPQIIADQENENGVLLPGRKERSVIIVSEDGEPAGYVLLQLVATEGRRSMLAGSRLIAVQPSLADPELKIKTYSMFDPDQGEELAIRVEHSFPCSLSVIVRDMAGNTVRRLAYKEPSRPLGMETEGSIFYWDGKNNADEAVPKGDYFVEVSCKMDDFTYYENSETITID